LLCKFDLTIGLSQSFAQCFSSEPPNPRFSFLYLDLGTWRTQ
jgi:hypothetical protein